MAEVESKLRTLQQFKSSPNHPSKHNNKAHTEPHFLPEAGKSEGERWYGGLIEDDHIPFQARGVDILHMIPTPFPSVWHNMNDDGEHLDLDTVEDWTKLVTAFAAEWLDLEGFFEKTTSASAEKAIKEKRGTLADSDRSEL